VHILEFLLAFLRTPLKSLLRQLPATNSPLAMTPNLTKIEIATQCEVQRKAWTKAELID
jgi:hypothetical protein